MDLGSNTRKQLLSLAKSRDIRLSKSARASKPALVKAIAAVLGKPTGKKSGKKVPKKVGQIVKSKEGLGVMETWENLFLQNELAFENGRKKDVLTDEQIYEAMKRAFPGRVSKIFEDVRRVRARYNRDNWSLKTKRGDVVCFRYVLNGKGRAARADSHGKSLS